MSRAKRIHKLFFVPTVTLIILAGAFICLYQAIKNRYISINEWSLGPNSVRGVDISAYQVDVDMRQLKEQGIQFVYIKATEGRSHVDEYFTRNWANARVANLPAGAYHFFNFESSGVEQAENYINTAGSSLGGYLLPAVDVEIYYANNTPIVPNRDNLRRELRAMLSRLEQQYGVKPIIYAQKDFYETYLTDFADYPRWIRDVYVPAKWKNGNDWLIWQYNDRGQLSGYSGGEKYIDLDVINSNKTLDDLRVE